MNKILIIQTAFIGDVILATALVEKLYQFYPNSQLDFLVRKGNEGLLKAHPTISNVLVWDKKTRKYGGLKVLLSSIRKTKYDVVINLQRFTSTGVLTAFSGAKHKIGFKKNPLSFFFNKKVAHKIGDGTHEVERNQQLISHLTDPVASLPKLYPSTEDLEEVAQYKQNKYVCMAPTSVWFTKQLPQAQWVKLSEKIAKKTTVYLLGGPTDISECEEIRLKSNNKEVVNLTGKLSFLQSAALMQDAQMNYVNDSAPLHIASAMNAPVTAFFCSTVPSFGFTPLSDNKKIVEVQQKLPCRPCGLHGKKACPQQHFNCGHQIEV